jgi:acetyl esterase/lipase
MHRPLTVDLLRAFAVTARARSKDGPLRARWSLRTEAYARFMRSEMELLRGLPTPRQRAIREARTLPDPMGPRLHVEGIEVAGMAARDARPRGGPTPRTVLFFHGGGYCWGSTRTHAEMISRIALASGARVVAVNYRLAPEHPYPAAHDDAFAAWRWLLGQGTDPGSVVLAGDSAGGGLALALLLRIRDAGAAMPAGAVAICPWVDLTMVSETIDANAPFDFADRALTTPWRDEFVGSADPKDPRISPLYADLTGLPPLLVQTGTAEILHGEARAFHRMARRAQVSVELQQWPDMFHDWHFFALALPEARAAYTEIGRFVRRVTA